jgi:uncharacterized coiled-coil protein SlyX
VSAETSSADTAQPSSGSTDLVRSDREIVDRFRALEEVLANQSAKLDQLQKVVVDQQRMIQRLIDKLAGGEVGSLNAQAGNGQVNSTQNSNAQVKPEPATNKPAPKPAQSVEAGYGKIKFDGLLQAWFTGGNGGVRDSFRLRRTELKFSGDITPKAKWTVMIDPAKVLQTNNTFTVINGTRVLANTSINQPSRILQDAFISLSYIKNVRIDFGQFKIPLSLEGLQSSAALDTVERALFASDRARGGSFGDIRDFGVMASGSVTSYADYQLGLFNGSGEEQNDVDRNNHKTLIGRFVVRPPFIKGLQVGGSGALDNGRTIDRPRRNRLGAEVLLTRGPFKFKSEVMSGVDSDTHRLGYYAHFGYRIRPKLEPILRFDSFDPDTRLNTNSSNVIERDYITGFNYYIRENNLKLQFNYLRKTFGRGIVPSRNVVMINLQTAW